MRCILFRCYIHSEQAVPAEGDVGVCEVGEACPAGARHLHHQRECIRTCIYQSRSVSHTYINNSYQQQTIGTCRS